MIQINLIPDVKSEFLKAQATRRVIQTVAFVVSAAAIGLLVFSFIFVKVWQQRHTNALQDDIGGLISDLQDEPDLDRVLTVKNQLDALPKLHGEKTLSSNIADYLTKITPANISYASIEVNFEDFEISFRGDGEDPLAVNTYADILKFATYIVEEGDEPKNIFTDVVSEITLSGGAATSGFTMSAVYDQNIFVTENVTVIVPEIITTRSETERPKNLFDGDPNVQEAAQ